MPPRSSYTAASESVVVIKLPFTVQLWSDCGLLSPNGKPSEHAVLRLFQVQNGDKFDK